jgi:hypothetical protein
MFERTKGVIRSRKSKKVKQFNGQWISDKRTNNDLRENEQENKYCETRTPQKTGSALMCSGTVNSSCSTSGIRHATLIKKGLKIPKG